MSLKSAWLDTPLGSMLAISDEERLYLLDFAESKGLEHKIKRLKIKTKSAITEERTKPISSIEEEFKLYFNGTSQKFNTPVYLLGSEF